MRLNENTVLEGQQVVLVPYRVEHVAVYHAWMQVSAIDTVVPE